jgi:hypothetical protein
MAAGGRPTALTPKTAAAIVDMVEKGAPFAVACEAAGVHRSTGYRWRKQGKPDEGPEEFRAFRDALLRARARAEQRLLATIDLAAPKDWKAAAWLLQKLNPRRYTDRQRTEHTGKEGKPLAAAPLAGVIILPALDHLDEDPSPRR